MTNNCCSEAPDDEVPALTSLARRVMENAATLSSMPLVVETGVGRTWAEWRTERLRYGPTTIIVPVMP